MKKILFYDKQIFWNAPDYALNLLHKLQEDDFKVLISFGKPTNREVFLKSEFELIYSNFDTYEIKSFSDIRNVFDVFCPDIFISNFALLGFERKVLEYAYYKGTKIFELDHVGNDIITYNGNWLTEEIRLRPRSLMTITKTLIQRKMLQFSRKKIKNQ